MIRMLDLTLSDFLGQHSQFYCALDLWSIRSLRNEFCVQRRSWILLSEKKLECHWYNLEQRGGKICKLHEDAGALPPLDFLLSRSLMSACSRWLSLEIVIEWCTRPILAASQCNQGPTHFLKKNYWQILWSPLSYPWKSKNNNTAKLEKTEHKQRSHHLNLFLLPHVLVIHASLQSPVTSFGLLGHAAQLLLPKLDPTPLGVLPNSAAARLPTSGACDDCRVHRWLRRHGTLSLASSTATSTARPWIYVSATCDWALA
jgi:hypothetical protein